MPDYHVTYRIHHPVESEDVTGVDTREHAIDQIVKKATDDGDTVTVLQAEEIVTPVAPPEVPPEEKTQ